MYTSPIVSNGRKPGATVPFNNILEFMLENGESDDV